MCNYVEVTKQKVYKIGILSKIKMKNLKRRLTPEQMQFAERKSTEYSDDKVSHGDDKYYKTETKYCREINGEITVVTKWYGNVFDFPKNWKEKPEEYFAREKRVRTYDAQGRLMGEEVFAPVKLNEDYTEKVLIFYNKKGGIVKKSNINMKTGVGYSLDKK